MSAGLFIAFEGIDGAGTTSQIRALGAWLNGLGVATTTTHEPSALPIGRLARSQLALVPPGQAGPRGHALDAAEQGSDLAVSEAGMALLFAADRLHHREQVVAPALAAGHVVLCDRYLWSSYAYQASVLAPAWVEAINAQAPPADVTVYLSVSLAVARARRAARGLAHERFDADERQERAKARYDQLAAAHPCVTVAGDPAQPAVAEALQKALQPHLALYLELAQRAR